MNTYQDELKSFDEVVRDAWHTGGASYQLPDEHVTVVLTGRNTPFVTFESGEFRPMEPRDAHAIKTLGRRLES